MKTPHVLAGTAATAIAALFLILPIAANAAGATWNVSVGNPGACTVADRNCATIQAAINAASSGDTINVSAGNYDAFKVIGRTNLTISGSGTGQTFIKPTTLIDSGVGHKYAADMLASVFVNQSSGITIKGMDIESTSAAPGAGGADAVVFWNASSGTIQSDKIDGIYAINGDQTGQGIAVDAGSGQVSNLTVKGTDIKGFQKNAIDAVDGNSSASNPGVVTVTLQNGSITGAGSTNTIAQNGILVWNKGGGTVTGSVNGTNIKNLEYAPTPEAAGVLAVGSASYTGVSNVTFKNVDSYIDSASSGSPIEATNGNTFDGVAPGSATTAQLATIENKLDGEMETSGIDPIFILPHTWIVTTSNLGIQTALNDASNGDTVLVTPGPYSGNFIINKSITFDGAQYGQPVSGRTFNGANESTISGAAEGTGVVTITASGVTVDGFSITDVQPAFSALGLVVKNGGDNAIVQNNIFNDITTADTGGNGTAQAVYFEGAVNGVQILNNSMNDITSNRSAKGVLFGDNGGNDNATNATVEGNSITNVTSTAKGAYGISFGNTTNPQSGITIKDNTISGLMSGGWIHAIGVEGNAPSIDITGNTISNLTASSSSNVIGIWFESEDTSFSSAEANNNSLAVGANQLGLAVDPSLTGGTVNATCNWWGDSSGPGGVGSGSGSEINAGATYIPWLTSSNLNGPCNGAPTVTVTIDKFIDGEAASTTSATASFPMASSWNATNIGSGSGTYSLGTTGFNSPNAYEAVTAQMTAGADYATNEVTGGSVVGADCSGGQPFELAGYTSGNTLADAESATVVPTSPSLTNIQNNTWVIVWNKLCVPTPTITTPTNGTVTTSANLTEADWTSVTDAAGGITYTYQASNSPAVNGDGSFATTVYSQGGISATSIPTSGTPEGTYYIQVQAKDADGNVSGWSPTVEVTVDNSPSVMTDAATGVTDTNGTLNGTDGAINGDDTSFWWGTTNAGPFTASANPGSEFPAGWNHDSGLGTVSANGQFNEAFTTLTPGTTYYFVAWVEVGGTWYPGSVLMFSTTGTALTPSVTTDTATGVDMTDGTLNGQNGAIAADNTSFWWGTTNAGPFTSGTNPGATELPAGWSHDSGLGAAGVNGSFDEPLSGLTPGTTYYFAAWSEVGGTWYPGAVESFMTASPANVDTDAATGVTSSDAQLNGKIGPNDAQGHSFWVSTAPFATSSPTIPAGVYSTPDMGAISANTDFNATLSSITMDGVPSDLPAIQPNTTYYFVAWANVGSTWYPGAELSFTTGDTAPVISNEHLSTTPTTATITWDTDHNSTSRVVYGTVSQSSGATNTCSSTPGNVSYECYGYSNSTDETDTPANTNGVIHHSVTVTGLTTGTTYFFRPVSVGSPESEGSELSGTPDTTTLPVIAITPGPQAFSGTVGSPFSETFTASDTAGDTFNMSEDGVLPDGLSTSTTPNTVTITGTPTTVSGPLDFDINAASSTDSGNFTSQAYSISISSAPPTPPTVVNDATTTNMNTEVTIDVLANDTNASGIDAASITTPTGNGGTVAIDGDKIDYTPATNYAGTDTFTYEAYNSAGTSTPATVSVMVKDTTTPVLAVNGSNPANIEVNSTYSDLGATITDTPTNGLDLMVSLDGEATTTFTAFNAADLLSTSTPGTHTILYSATDGGGNTGYATRTVNVLVAPTLTLTSTSATTSTISNNPIPVTATFSEAVQSFTSADASTTNGVVSNAVLSGNGMTATFDVIPQGNGVVTVEVVPGAVANLAGGTNADDEQISFTYAAPVTPPSGGGGGGGGGGGNGPIAVTYSPYDLNHDGKVDILDFNILMTNFGKTGTSIPGDFNNDGVVNLADFNNFMVHWTS